jgi:hypothetical protein
MPAPDTPATRRIGGNQQQLEATIADTMVPTLAISSPRPDRGLDDPALFSVAPGDCLGVVPQQSGLRTSPGTGSSDMGRFLSVTENGAAYVSGRDLSNSISRAVLDQRPSALPLRQQSMETGRVRRYRDAMNIIEKSNLTCPVCGCTRERDIPRGM